MRIVSLVPSQTELLYNLGLDDEVAGITKFCIHPQHWFKTKYKVGGTKTVNIEKVAALKPTLIIANKEENVKEQVEALQQIAPVYVSDISTLQDALEMINTVGELTNKQAESANIIFQITKGFQQLKFATNSPGQNIRAAYLIWQNPYMAAGGDTFINDMMQHCGWVNVFAGKTRYPEVSAEQISAHKCQVLMLSSEPFPFKQKHVDELQALLPDTKIILVDGEMFSWYGSRLLLAPNYFKSLLKDLQLIH